MESNAEKARERSANFATSDRTADATDSPNNPENLASLADVRSLPDDALRVWQNIERLGLTREVAQLEVLGYAVIPPEKVAPAEFIDTLREKLFDVVERRIGTRPDLQADTPPSAAFMQKDTSGSFANYTYLLLEDPVFQKAAMNEAVLAMIDLILGKNAVLATCLSLMKGPGDADLTLHADNLMTPAPYSRIEHFCNVTWCLTDYSRESGSICFVPGSHKYARPPGFGESSDDRVAIEAPAGSVIIWPGSTWHGAFAKKTPGLRVNLINQFIRPVFTGEPYRENVTPEILAANPRRFSTLMGQDLNSGWKEEGPQNERVAYNRGRHPYD
ncbi:phytanoyl-CoA dioxygenase family protein [Novosphingobium pentaromativorans]|uniref:phytanoyl-CoA dioxygenase family protein n=1 Tax=Novosphingobium pentaromativorans TaxID=205844 RepID=UPI000587E0F3|nr:phytanoyl-CoA dioxygenase family protein [Novosphingobium pentaromativorans]